VRWMIPFAVGLVMAGRAGQAQTLPGRGVYALVGVRVEIGDGRVLEKGTVVLRNGLIEAVGAEVTVPPDAEVFKGDGLTVYPGFIDAQTTTGLNLPPWQPNQDTPPDTGAIAPASMREANRKGVRPELRAGDYLALADATLGPIRQQGFTTALIAPSGGTINGMGALVNLSGMPKRESIVRSNVAMGFAFSTTGGGRRGGPPSDDSGAGGTGYPGSLLGIIAHLRQTLLDARWFRTVQTGFENGNGQRPPADEALAALQPVLNGTLPVLFDAGSENEILRAIKLSDEFKLRLIVSGGVEAWKQAPLLAKRQIPVLADLNFGDEPGVSKTGRAGESSKPGAPPKPGETSKPPADVNRPERPPADPKTPLAGDIAARESKDEDEDETPKAVVAEQHRKWEEKVANAAQLQKAGVLFAFSTRGTKGPAEFWKNLRRAIQAGLPRQAALQALTLNAARIFGVEKQMGTVEVGKIADLVVMTGDFADPKSRVRYLFIDRSKFDPENDPASRPAPPTAPPMEDE
jgi:imidazolonepropionase-like amidohydrolase